MNPRLCTSVSIPQTKVTEICSLAYDQKQNHPDHQKTYLNFHVFPQHFTCLLAFIIAKFPNYAKKTYSIIFITGSL